MKYVHTKEMVAHLWAHQSQDSAKTANRAMYFNGDTIYSYGSHFPMAKWITNFQGERIALVNSDSYSSSTSTHQWAVAASIPSYVTKVYLSSKDFFGISESDGKQYLRDSDYDSISSIFTKGCNRIMETMEKQSRARSSDYRPNAVHTINQLRDIFKAFDLNVSHSLSSGAKLKPILPHLLDKNIFKYRDRFEVLKDLHTIKNVWVLQLLVGMGIFELTETGEFKIQDIDMTLITELFSQISGISGVQLTAHLEKLVNTEKVRKLEDKKRAIEKRKKYIADVEKWKSGDLRVNFPYNYSDYDTVALRVAINPEKKVEMVNTSKGIWINFEEALKLFKFLIAVKDKNKPFTHELVMDSGNHKWKIDSISADGTLKAGCHKVPFSESERIAQLLNFAA